MNMQYAIQIETKFGWILCQEFVLQTKKAISAVKAKLLQNGDFEVAYDPPCVIHVLCDCIVYQKETNVAQVISQDRTKN